MARYTGPKCKLCRREGEKLFLKGTRCVTVKCAIAKRAYPPGEHPYKRGKVSEYGRQLREKQKAKRSYGILERQFRRYYALAEREKGNTGENLLRILERRLDNVVYLAGFGASRAAARQMIRHGHIQINDHRADVPGMLVKPGDIVKARSREGSQKLVGDHITMSKERGVPPWVKVEADKKTATVLALPKREEFSVPIQENLIVELCSK